MHCFIVSLKMKFESMLLFCIGLFMQLTNSGPKIIKSLIVLCMTRTVPIVYIYNL